jgi:hypothetical protein
MPAQDETYAHPGGPDRQGGYPKMKGLITPEIYRITEPNQQESP